MKELGKALWWMLWGHFKVLQNPRTGWKIELVVTEREVLYDADGEA